MPPSTTTAASTVHHVAAKGGKPQRDGDLEGQVGDGRDKQQAPAPGSCGPQQRRHTRVRRLVCTVVVPGRLRPVSPIGAVRRNRLSPTSLLGVPAVLQG